MEIVNVVEELPEHRTLKYSERENSPQFAVIHHLGVEFPDDLTDDQKLYATAMYHIKADPRRDKDEWPGIGYAFVVVTSGTIYQTQPADLMTYHAGDVNPEALGICLEGDFTDHPPTREQIESTRWLLEQLQLNYVGHQDVMNTSCPGNTWDEWKDKLKSRRKPVSKLGIHTQTEPERSRDSDNRNLADLIADSPIEAIKAINPNSWPEPLPTMFPNVKRGYARFWIGGDHKEHDLMRQGAQGAEEYYDMLADRYERALDMGWEYFTGPNEPHPTLWLNTSSADKFWLRWVELVEALGAIPYVGQFGNGWPAEGAASLYADSIAAATEAGGGLEVHEYGFPAIRSGEPFMFGRHKQTVAELAQVDVYPRVIVGEVGVTRAVRGGPDEGWKSMSSWVYPPMFGLPERTMDYELWWRMMSDADDEYCKYDYIKDVFPFLSWPQSDWATHDWGEWHIRRQIEKWQTMPEPALGLLPSAETAEDVATLTEKARYWLEEYARQHEGGDREYADAILYDLIDPEKGLLYRAERAAKDV